MSAWLGIDPILMRLTHIAATDNDWASTFLITLVVALGGAGLGLFLVCVRVLLARLRSSDDRHLAKARSRATFPPDVPHSLRRLPQALPSASVDDSPTIPGVIVVEVDPPWTRRRRSSSYAAEARESRGAGEAWLDGFMEKLRLVLPGLERELPATAQGADATLQIDARILARIVRDLGETDPVTLVMPSVEALSPDSTVKTTAMPLLLDSPPSNETLVEFRGFQYGARRG